MPVRRRQGMKMCGLRERADVTVVGLTRSHLQICSRKRIEIKHFIRKWQMKISLLRRIWWGRQTCAYLSKHTTQIKKFYILNLLYRNNMGWLKLTQPTVPLKGKHENNCMSWLRGMKFSVFIECMECMCEFFYLPDLL